MAGRARELRVEPGEAVVRRWDSARDFFVVVDGDRARRRSTASRSRGSAPGDFFGELAALDWGAGYGYARSAT